MLNKITIYYKKNRGKLDIVALKHVFVPGVWLFYSFKRAKPAGFRPCHRIDQKWSFPFAVHFTLLFALQDATKNEVALFDFLRPQLHVAPPSSFLLVSAKVDCRLCFDSFDCVDCWLDVFVRCFGFVGSMSKFFWCHCLFAIEELERSEYCGP